MVGSNNGSRPRRGGNGVAVHAHAWLISAPDGALSEGVCRRCGARRDFVANVRRTLSSPPRSLRALCGEWLVEVARPAPKLQEVKMDDQERQAQRIALTHLVRGCEEAVSELLVTVKQAGEQSAPTKRAREILAEMLSTWRQALGALSPKE